MNTDHTLGGALSATAIDRDFLAKIIPDDGYYITFQLIRKTEKKRQRYHHDLDDMVDEIAKAASGGWDVYHACASFKTDNNRYAQNARSLKALFLDLDRGDDKANPPDGSRPKGYATKQEALEALKAFCTDIGLPRPLVVDSGGGVHAYWPFEGAVAVAEWITVARRLKAVCEARGLLADPAVTADAARILRPVGSFNFKYDPPQRVQMVRDARPRCFSELQGIIDAVPHPRRCGDARSPHHAPLLVKKATATLAQQVNPHGYDLVAVEEALRQLDPDCGRPEWMRVGMAIADAFGEDGRDLFHRWSRGDLWEGA